MKKYTITLYKNTSTHPRAPLYKGVWKSRGLSAALWRKEDGSLSLVFEVDPEVDLRAQKASDYNKARTDDAALLYADRPSRHKDHNI